MDEDFADLTSEEPEQVALTKDRVRGPSGRRLPQRKSMMPVRSPLEEIEHKQRSVSLTSQPEDMEESSTNEVNSLSLDGVNKDENGVNETKKVNSNGIIFPKKLSFGRLGGPQSALKQELELKLKSGLAPGGRRLVTKEPLEEPDSGSKTAEEVKNLQNKLGQQETALNTVKSNLETLEKRVQDLDANLNNLNNSTEQAQNIFSQVHDVLSETAVALKEMQDTNSQCEKILEELEQTKTEHQEFLKESKKYLNLLKESSTSSFNTPDPEEII